MFPRLTSWNLYKIQAWIDDNKTTIAIQYRERQETQQQNVRRSLNMSDEAINRHSSIQNLMTLQRSFIENHNANVTQNTYVNDNTVRNEVRSVNDGRGDTDRSSNHPSEETGFSHSTMEIQQLVQNHIDSLRVIQWSLESIYC